MAEITKVTTPLVPRENLGNKYKPDTDQAFELTDPSKIHKPVQEGKLFNQKAPDGQTFLRESMGRAAIEAILRGSDDVVGVLKRMALLVETGVSASDAFSDPRIKELMSSLFLSPRQLTDNLVEQDKAAVLFKGEAFDILRDLMSRFEANPKVQGAIANLLKIFEHNVNSDNSIKSIIHSCENILSYMFTKDRDQFASYLDGLAEMLLPREDTQQALQHPSQTPEQAETEGNQQALPKEATAQPQLSVSQKEAAQILKSNLLPLLGEIVVKYHQNDKIRDHVMTVVHNIVRVDQGTPDAIRSAVNQLASELRKVANLPEHFAQNLFNSVTESSKDAKSAQNDIISKLTEIISQTLRSENSNPAAIRQAENLMMSLLQNQSTMMNVLHFVLPLQTATDQIFAELYVDPDSPEHSGKQSGKESRKFFLSFESESHGSFELSFVQTDEYVDFSMWCPGILVPGLGGLKRYFTDIMQTHGYTMNSFRIEEYKRAQSVADVFPKLLEKRVGIDVRV